MGRIRMIGALLAVVTAISAAVFARGGFGLTAGLLIAGAVPLALVAPFAAHMPPARRRVALAAQAYTLFVALASTTTLVIDHRAALAVILAVQAIAGAALAWRAFRTRNRRRRESGMRTYFRN